jgi:hypothetical protein
MADRPTEPTGSAAPADAPDGMKRVVNPTLITPGPRPLERDGSDGPQVLQGEVIGGKHVRPRPAGGKRRRTAAGAILSAAGAAAALFLLISKHSEQTPTAATHDTFATAKDRVPSAVPTPDRSGGLVRGAVVGTESPSASHSPAAAPRPVTARTTAATATTPAARHRGPARWGTSTQERKRYEEAMRRWAKQYAAEHSGHGQARYESHQGHGWHGGGHRWGH